MTTDRNCSAGIGDLKRLAGPRARPAIETPPKKTARWVPVVVAIAAVIGAIVVMGAFIDVLLLCLTSTDPVRH